jgi:hypothetical protein
VTSTDTQTGWTVAWRKRTANRFQRATDVNVTWAQSLLLADRLSAARPELQVYYVPTRAAELAGRVVTEDHQNILTETRKRVRVADTGRLSDMGVYMTLPDPQTVAEAWSAGDSCRHKGETLQDARERSAAGRARWQAMVNATADDGPELQLAPEAHAFTDDGSDPGNCAVCHFFHTDLRGPAGERLESATELISATETQIAEICARHEITIPVFRPSARDLDAAQHEVSKLYLSGEMTPAEWREACANLQAEREAQPATTDDGPELLLAPEPCTSEHPDYPGLICHAAGPHAGHYAMGHTWPAQPEPTTVGAHAALQRKLDALAEYGEADLCLATNRDHTCLRPILVDSAGHGGLHSDGIAAWHDQASLLLRTVAGAAYELHGGPNPSDTYDGSAPVLSTMHACSPLPGVRALQGCDSGHAGTESLLCGMRTESGRYGCAERVNHTTMHRSADGVQWPQATLPCLVDMTCTLRIPHTHPRCSTCHRSAHRLGMHNASHHGHAYTAPAGW